jgi:hypothetical protein
MKFAVTCAVVGVAAILLAGCSSVSGLLDDDAPVGQQASVPQDLTMPPDLQLAPPGTAPASVAPAEPSAPDGGVEAMAPAAPVTPAARPSAVDDVYAKAGISLYGPDGTRKSDADLREELRQYYIAQKRQKNPNYGTVFNMGNIFKDE